ncbi:PaaI family thioesterase [Dethiobacter alkaliphilus]|uniref:Acyl-coenzyme A thioesterase THEM4 n=1 Tax=Dethiobacter alkaliphilus AHT 1 TaxID=555088 RepID=C0GK01_DETAL|nr:hotdog fold domain-containing protein [Dethiobacter alkaliphilus]EEG76370.1 thioesterase superfamily protein [Dethiobacter alkaliphilus AHT 1]MCW3489806.1 hotdog fold thioesterase [Dethiobacter alkaliphilus]
MEFADGNRCFVCGMDNPHGLRLTFQWDGEEYFTEFYTDERYQGYNGVTHGGITATILDEVMAKHLTTRGLGVVTASMELRYRKPVPTGVKIRCVAHLVEHKRNIFKMGAKAILPDGVVAVEAAAKFVQIGDIKETGEE